MSDLFVLQSASSHPLLDMDATEARKANKKGISLFFISSSKIRTPLLHLIKEGGLRPSDSLKHKRYKPHKLFIDENNSTKSALLHKNPILSLRVSVAPRSCCCVIQKKKASHGWQSLLKSMIPGQHSMWAALISSAGQGSVTWENWGALCS